MEGFAHTHQDDVGNVSDGFTDWEACSRPSGGAQFTREVQHLGHNLARAQVTIKAHLPGSAEGTTEGTACLCGDADGGTWSALAAGGIEHQHGLDQFAISELQ